jgi:6-phosphogluconolactonase
MTALALLLASMVPAADKEPAPEKLWVYIGTYTEEKKSKGIYLLELDLATGKLTSRGLAGELTHPSFLAIHPKHRFLYAVTEVSDIGDKKTGGVAAFAIDAKTGKLKLLNKQSTGGSGPCHVVVDKAGKNVLAANYGGGSACCIPIQEDGSLGKATAFKQHKGSSVNKDRQEGPHAHSINLDPANRFAFVADLGLDKVMIYKFDADKGTLTDNDPPSVSVTAGAGPRHFAFHPSGKYAYVINEMHSTITALKYDPKTGTLKVLETQSTIPKEPKVDNSTAEVQVHPSGKFVYGSNRGHNSIAIFRVVEDTGKLVPVGRQGKGIKVPRNFGIDPTGKFLLVANQDGDSVIVFRIDQKTGELTPTDSKVDMPKPVCVKFVPAGS